MGKVKKKDVDKNKSLKEVKPKVDNKTDNRADNKTDKKISRKVLIRVGYVLLALFVILGLICNFTLGYKKIFNGVHINGVYVGGSTVEEATKILTEYYQNLNKMTVAVYCDDESTTISGEEISASFDAKKAAEVAIKVGKDGNTISRIFSGIRCQLLEKNVDVDINYERLKLDSKVEKLISKVGKEVVQPSYSIDGNKLYVTTGTTGLLVDEVALTKEVISRFNRMENRSVSCNSTKVKPNLVDVEKIRNEVYKEVQDAKYKNDSGAFEVTEAVTGVDFDLEEAKKIADSVKDVEGEQFTIDLIITLPNLTVEQVLADLFQDELSTFTTNFKVSEVDRTENVKLSAQAINGTILMPGQEFSYNDTVGERSLERGFKVAKVYASGTVVDGLGGGICQTSSTLYNSVLLADLEVTERSNHSLSVAYVPLGRDATVSYGSKDFKFKNNRKTPIKIESKISGGTLTIKILGIKDSDDRTISLRTETVGVRDFSETIIEDPTMPVGSSEIVTYGKKGYTVKAYKVISKNGVKVEEKLISTDTYSPIVQVKKVGTLAPVVETTYEETYEGL